MYIYLYFAALDESIGEVVQSLTDENMYDNTVIIFSTDNGGNVNSGASNFPFRGNKNSFYEAGM